MLEEKTVFVGGVEFTPDRKSLVRFPEDSDMTDYTVPEGGVEIGINAFFHCQQLQSVTLPQSLREIDSNAFQLCGNLRQLVIPKNVKKIAPNAFLDCPAKLVSESPDFTIDQAGAVIHRRNTLLCIPSALQYYEVPKEVIRIGDDACAFSALQEIILPEYLLAIGDRAFVGAGIWKRSNCPPRCSKSEAAHFI